MIKIERHIPPPPPRRPPLPWGKLLDRMNVGESILVNLPINSVTSAIARCVARNPGFRFTCQSKRIEGGTRIWRVR